MANVKSNCGFYDADKAAAVKQGLINAGLTEPALSMAFAQSAFETSGWTAPKMKDDLNVGGMLYNPAEAKYGAFPSQTGHFNTDSGKGTAAFNNINDSTNCYVKFFLSSNRGKSGRPIDATDVNTYVSRLQANYYFGNGSASQYYAGIQKWQKCLGGVAPGGDPSIVNNAANVATNNSNSETVKKNMKITMDEIQSNVQYLSSDNVDVSWGSRSNPKETSDWIGLRQFLMYLSMTYEPQALLPFVELIPKFFIDESQTAELWKKSISSTQNNTNPTDLSSIKKNEEFRFLNLKSKFNALQSNKGIDLFVTDPFKDVQNFKDDRNFGYRIYGSVVLNPEIKNEETSLAGGIGFKSVEISQGAQVNEGLTFITIKILDVQGNKFLDVASPWSFLLNTVNQCDFYFRYGWQIRIPKYDEKNNDKTSTEWKFPVWL